MIRLTEDDLHPHLRRRMAQRGVSVDELEKVLNNGWEASDAKPGTEGKVLVFPHSAEPHEGFYSEKEVTAYYKHVEGQLIVLTVKARYGQLFPRGQRK